MLRITHTIELSFRKSESRFSSDFWKGLGAALLIHCSLFGFFRIASFSHWDTLEPLPALLVETDLIVNQPIQIYPVKPSYSPLEKFDPPSLESANAAFLQIAPEPYRLQKGFVQEPDFSEIEKFNYTPLDLLNNPLWQTEEEILPHGAIRESL